jgi:formylglycine-generating enzyme required for sulfatase activity
VGFEEQLRSALVGLLDQPDQAILLPQRVEAGAALGELGDPRFPVTADEWKTACARCEPARITYHASLVTPYWCSVWPSSYGIGGREAGEQAATIDLQGYWISRFPITVAQYAPFVTAGYGPDAERWWTPNGWAWKQARGRTQPWGWNEARYAGRNQPVIGVTWYEATAFCAWLSDQLADALPESYVVRLPSEAEWEAAAAYDADMQRPTYPWGEDAPTPERAISDASGLNAPAPVGCCVAGAAVCGVLDLAGNVWEWMASSFSTYPQQSAEAVKDFTMDKGDVPLRGSSWRDNSTYVRCGARYWGRPGVDGQGCSFRVNLAPSARTFVLISVF